MSIPEACCTLPPVTSDYKPKGTEVTLGDMEVYKVGDPNSEVTLISVYDVFGFHNNTFQVCDMIAQQGFHVVMPDFFRGKPWSLDNFPPKDFNELRKWAYEEHSWSKTQQDIKTVLEASKGEIKSNTMGIFGFCWGGKMVFDALKMKDSQFLSGAAIHPAMISDEDISSITRPIIGVFCDGEADLVPKCKLLQSSIAGTSKWLDFTDQIHGFCSARGNFEDPKNKQRVTDALNEIVAFFKHTLSN